MRSGSVVVVGGGPCGVLLTYLLARAGVEVTLLEARGDFARRFRGDTLAPAVLDYLDELGLAADLLAEVPHTRSDAFRWHTPDRTYTLVDYRRASRRHPFYALIPQARFLPWLAARAERLGATVLMGARFSDLRRADGRVTGVEYTVGAAVHTIDADLVVGADGRNSKVRTASGATATELGASLDLLWFALPREPTDPAYSGLDLFARPGGTLALLDQGATWQIGWSVPAGSFTGIRAGGVEPLLASVDGLLPWLAPRLRAALTEPSQLTLLPVRITSVDRWAQPGLLLIGDAAHVISPVGGNGINLAMADAAEAANQLVGPLLAGGSTSAVDAAAAHVEALRRPGTDREQRGQVRTERRAASSRDDPRPPLALRVLCALPGASWLLGRSRVRLPAPIPAIRDRPVDSAGSAVVDR